jgi:hypothetical protein
MREFDTGATRDTDENKLDYEGFLSPLVLERYAQYMNKNRIQADGKARASDNWQKGIPKDAYMKSAWRHFMEWWTRHRGLPNFCVEEAICALLFNAMGYLHEILKSRHPTVTVEETDGSEVVLLSSAGIFRYNPNTPLDIDNDTAMDSVGPGIGGVHPGMPDQEWRP